MPTLNWIGKAAVVKHHQEVPYRLLEPVPELSLPVRPESPVRAEPVEARPSTGTGRTDDYGGNLIVQGDNLLALKALLPRYAGQVKCIYIDPPYNTGNEGWVYNDNVNSPEIRKWLGEVVGREGETLDRHDRWLCMMYPRLVLLRQFLRENGVILISIDDFESHNLRILMDEIFGQTNFIAQLVWDKTRKNDAKLFSVGHEYLLVYARSLKKLKEQKTVWREQKPGAPEVIAKWKELSKKYGENYDAIQNELRDWYKGLEKNHPAKKLSRTRWVDKYGPWRDRDISWPGGNGPRYDVIHPQTGLPCKVPEPGWRFASIDEMNRQIALGLVVFRDDHTEPPICKAHLLPIPEELESSPSAEDEDGDAEVSDEEAGLLVMPSVIHKQAQVSVKLLRQIFNGKKVFENPKDHEIISRLIRYVTESNDIILDSFAGSGTTGHAVLKQNAEDGGKRRFILVEMDENIARNVTAERVKRVAQGYVRPSTGSGREGEKVDGLGGGFQFCTLSKEPLFTAEGQIRGDMTFAQLAEFVWFKETGVGLPPHPPVLPPGERGFKSPLIGVHEGRAIYLLYNGILKDKSVNGGNVLTGKVLELLPPFDGPKVIYAAACRLGEPRLRREGIVFKQTPYALAV